MTDELLLGFDVGTSSVKAAAFGLDGTPVGVATAVVALQRPGDGLCEVDPRAYWRALRQCCGTLADAGVELRRVQALSIAAHAETLIPVDDKLEPVRPAIVWVDTRSTREAADLVARFGADELARRSGQPLMIPMWPATKLLWLQRHEPDLVQQVRWWLQPLDYLVAKMTGHIASDASEYSSSLLLDIGTRGWWQPMLDELAISERVLPELRVAGSAIARLRAEAAAELGLGEALVVMGGFDQACTAVGSGNVRAGGVSESTGSSLAVITTIREPPAARGAVPCHVHVIPGHYFLDAHSPTAGAAYAWLRNEFAPELSFRALDELAEEVPAGSDGLLLLPWLAGTATPSFEPMARGVLFGLSLDHGRGHVARATLEGVAFELAALLDESCKLGSDPRELRSVGGGARSPLWSQIKADVTALPVSVPVIADHAGALGAAILAAVGADVFPTIEAGVDALVRLERTYAPDPIAHERYSQVQTLHDRLSSRLEALFGREQP
jgi:xylulokinase